MTTNDKDTKQMPSVDEKTKPMDTLDQQSHEMADAQENKSTNTTNPDKSAKKPKYANQTTAHKRIAKELKVKGIEYDDDALVTSLSQLYDSCQQEMTIPTREGFAEVSKDDAVNSAVLEMEKNPFRAQSKAPAVVAIIAAIVIIAGCIGAVIYMTNNQPEQSEEPATAEVETVEAEGVQVNVTCEGWNAETSTPIALAIYEGDVKDALLSTDENVEVPTPINEISLNAGEDIKLEDIVDAGTYTLSIVGSPVLEDGTIFTVPEPQVIEYDGETGQIVKFELVKKDASEVTEADLAAATAAAASLGADATNAVNNTRSQASSAQGGSISQGQSTGQSKPSGGNSSGGSTSGGSSSSGGSNNGGNSSTHTHNWVAQYTTKQVPIYQTVQVQVGSQIKCSCGATFPNSSAYVQHANQFDIGTGHDNSSTVPIYESREELVGYDTEQVLTGYKCSCGATK